MQLDCLIVQQPYASLISVGKKRWEFRSYDSNRRGTIGIAASPGPVFRVVNWDLNRIAGLLPRGVLLSIVDFDNSFFVTSEDLRRNLSPEVEVDLHGHKIVTLNEPIGEPSEDVERAIQSSTWESYVWLMKNVRPLKKPIPFVRASRSTWVTIEIPENALKGVTK
jgi:hypothetical protein